MAPKKKTLACQLPDDWILTDTEKKKWRLGKIIGQGGFGVIYLASDCVDAPVQEDTNYVIKVEFRENGSLFSELKFYQRAAKLENINKWKRNRMLDFLGIPTYWGAGLSEYQGTRYRFMVMDRLGTDLQKVIVENGGHLKKQTVLQLGCLMLDVLEYIHDNEYVHADIKGANLLLGHTDPGKVYLADYGLAYRYCPNGEHKEYKENPKKGHNGTIEYTSTDAHKGLAPSRRGDLEVLGYCLLHWQCGTLPWLSVLRNPVQVQEAKAKLIADLPNSVIQLSSPGSTTEIARFLLNVKALGYNEKPDYQALRKILFGAGPWGPLDLTRPRAMKTARPAMNRNVSSERAHKPKPVAEEKDGHRATGKSIPVKVRYIIQGESKTVDQEPWKAISTEADELRPGPSDEGQGRTQEGTKKRHKQKSAAGYGLRTDEPWLSTRNRQNDQEPRTKFIPDDSDSWGDYCTSPNEEDIDWNGHQWTERAHGYTDHQYRHTNRNHLEMHATGWSLTTYAGLVIVALLLVLVIAAVF